MLLRLLLAFTLIPLVEFYLLVQLTRATNFGVTVVLVLFTGVLGSWLARNQGLQVWRRFQTTLRSGQMPSREVQEGLMIAFAAALLLTPGVLTDLVGLLLLAPPTREIVRKFLARRLRNRFHMKVTGLGSAFQETAEPLQSRHRHAGTVDAEGVRPIDLEGDDEKSEGRIESTRPSGPEAPRAHAKDDRP